MARKIETVPFTVADLPTRLNLDVGDLRPGQYVAQGPAGQMTNLPGVASTVPQQAPRRVDLASAMRFGREMRTRQQQADLEGMARRQARLEALRARTAPLSMTMQGRQRVAAQQAAEARRQEQAVAAQRAGEVRQQRRLDIIGAEGAAQRGVEEVRQAGATERATIGREGALDVAEEQTRRGIREREITAESQERIAAEARREREIQDKVKRGAATVKEANDRRTELTDNIREWQIKGAEDPALASAFRRAVNDAQREISEIDSRYGQGQQAPAEAPKATEPAGAGDINQDGVESPAEKLYNRWDALVKGGTLTAAQEIQAKEKMTELRKRF